MILTTILALALTHSPHGKLSLIVVNWSALNPVPLSLKIKVRPYRGGNILDTTSLWAIWMIQKHGWLRDEANICHEISKRLYQAAVDRFSESWLVLLLSYSGGLIPINFDRNREIITCDSLSWSSLLISERVMFVPLNLGYKHWTLLALDSRHRSRCAVFWDPLGYRCPKEIWSKLSKFLLGLH